MQKQRVCLYSELVLEESQSSWELCAMNEVLQKDLEGL